jgi:predicted benzoate:H+ symporter BenE
MPRETSFLGALFDFSFRSFVTLRIVRFLYAVAVVFLVVGVVVAVVGGMAAGRNALEVVGFLLFAPIGAFLYLLIIRVSLELMVVIFRIGETQGQILEALRGGGTSPGATPPG